MEHRIRGTYVFVLVVVAMGPLGMSPALAGGFEVLEQGRSVGNANAGARATADDPATVYWNPAGMTRFPGHAAAITGSVIRPNVDFVDEGSFRLPPPPAVIPFVGELGNSDAASFTGSVYGVYSLNSRWKIGLGVNVPFGLTTDWGRTSIGRYHGTKSALMTVNINPSVAYRISRSWSAAVGVSAMYAEADLGSAIDFGALLMAPQIADGHVNVKGDSWGIGFNAGLLWEPTPCTRLGLHYRSRVKQDLEGRATFEVPAAAAPISAATGRFVDTDVTASLTMPDTAGLSVYHELSRRWAILGDVTWTGWSSVDELRVDFANPAEQASVTPYDWDDTWRVSLGVNFRPSRCWTLRLGTAWDQSPIPDATRTPRIPGNDRIWASAGVTWQPHRNWMFDVFYSHIFVEDGNVDLGEPATGFLIGHLESGVDVAGFQVTWKL